jgi:5'-nucleotidase
LKILVTNDDGIDSPGIFALKKEIEKLGETVVVAPDKERSTIGHALTLTHPLRITRVVLPDGDTGFAIDGTPSDCVILAMEEIVGEKLALVVSGINKGANLGNDITYSGTVSAAMEGTIFGIPSIAVSLAARENCRFEYAAKVARQIAKMVLEKGLPKNTLLNINVPNIPEGEITGIEITRQGTSVYEGRVVKRKDPNGRDYFWIDGEPIGDLGEGVDFTAIRENKVSITPLHLDMTNYAMLDILREWGKQLEELK